MLLQFFRELLSLDLEGLDDEARVDSLASSENIDRDKLLYRFSEG